MLPCFWSSGQDKTLLCNLPPVHPGFLWKLCLLCSKWPYSLDNRLGLHPFNRAHGHRAIFQFVKEARLGKRRMHLWTSDRLCFDCLWVIYLILLVSHHTDYVAGCVQDTGDITDLSWKCSSNKKTNQWSGEYKREKQRYYEPYVSGVERFLLSNRPVLEGCKT